MGEECKMFMKYLAEKLAEKVVEGYPFVISWLRTRVSFEILKSVKTSIRGSCQLFFRSEVVDDFRVNCTAAELFLWILYLWTPSVTEIFLFKLNEYVIFVEKRDM